MKLADHVELLADRRRLDAYARALEDAGVQGSTVADLGSGLGILAIAAARAGARRVYAVERDPVGRYIPLLAGANQCADRISWLEGDSRQLAVPEPVDLVIFDDFDLLDPRGSSVATLCDARDRWLSQTGRILPSRLSMWASLCDLPLPAEPPIALVPALADMRLQPRKVRLHGPGALVTAGERIASGAPDQLGREGFDLNWTTRADRHASLTGLVLWMVLDLTAGLTLELGPTAPRTAYPQIWLPTAPVPVSPGDGLEVSLRYRAPVARDGFHRLWDWSITGPGGRSSGNTFQAMEPGSLAPF